MRLQRARIRNYRSIKDTGWFELDPSKTILVGPNEGGKTAILRALEHLHPGRMAKPLDPLRDFPRSEYHRLRSGGDLEPSQVTVVEAEYVPDEDEQATLAAIAPAFAHSRYYRAVQLDNFFVDRLIDTPDPPPPERLEQAVRRLVSRAGGGLAAPPPAMAHLAWGGGPGAPSGAPPPSSNAPAAAAAGGAAQTQELSVSDAQAFLGWVETVLAPEVDASDPLVSDDLNSVRESLASVAGYLQVLETFREHVPVMIYTSSYPSVHARLHLGHLADSLDAGAVDESDEANFGNSCLLTMVNFSARELSDLGKAKEPEPDDVEGFQRYRSQLDERDAALNVASRRLTDLVRQVWRPTTDRAARGNDYTIRLTADHQYLKIAVEDSHGVLVELDQRSQGFQWLVSFLIVYFAQRPSSDAGTIMLLDEPGLSLHGLMQREFRHVLSRLGTLNQVVYTTHSPFLVGADELDRVRLVELTSRDTGTRVCKVAEAADHASLVPLQTAVGYELAGSTLAAAKTLLVRDLADALFLQGTSLMFADSHMATLDPEIEVVPTSTTGAMASLATLLSGQGLQVGALVDPDDDGDSEDLAAVVDTVGEHRVVRSKDGYEGPVPWPRIEELLRQTLVGVGGEVGWEVGEDLHLDWGARPIAQVFSHAAGPQVDRVRLAEAYLRWTATHRPSDLAPDEQVLWMKFIERLNRAFG